jgi:hypothetical protein
MVHRVNAFRFSSKQTSGCMQRELNQNHSLLQHRINNRKPLGDLQSGAGSEQQQSRVKPSKSVQHGVVPSRYAQGVYKPSSDLVRKTISDEVSLEIASNRPLKKSRMVAVIPQTQPSTSVVNAAKLSLKEKQMLKEKRMKRTGIIPKPAPSQKSVSTLPDVKLITSNRRRDSLYSQSHDSIHLDEGRMAIDMDSSVKIQPVTVSKPAKIIHVARASSLGARPKLAAVDTNVRIRAPSSQVELKRLKQVSPKKAIVKRRNKKIAVVSDPLLVKEYENDIYMYWREIEVSILFPITVRLPQCLIHTTCFINQNWIGECVKLWFRG